MNPLHLIDVLCGLLHAGQSVGQPLMLFCAWRSGSLQLCEQKRVFENPLDGFDEIGFQCGRMLLARVERVQKFLQRLISVAWNMKFNIITDSLSLNFFHFR